MFGELFNQLMDVIGSLGKQIFWLHVSVIGAMIAIFLRLGTICKILLERQGPKQ